MGTLMQHLPSKSSANVSLNQRKLSQSTPCTYRFLSLSADSVLLSTSPYRPKPCTNYFLPPKSKGSTAQSISQLCLSLALEILSHLGRALGFWFMSPPASGQIFCKLSFLLVFLCGCSGVKASPAYAVDLGYPPSSLTDPIRNYQTCQHLKIVSAAFHQLREAAISYLEKLVAHSLLAAGTSAKSDFRL